MRQQRINQFWQRRERLRVEKMLSTIGTVKETGTLNGAKVEVMAVNSKLKTLFVRLLEDCQCWRIGDCITIESFTFTQEKMQCSTSTSTCVLAKS